MDGYYGNYGAPSTGYPGVYDPTQPPPPQSYGQPTIGFAVDMPPNAPYYSQQQPAYSPYPNPPPQNYGSPYPNTGAPQPTIGFNIGSDPSAPPDNISSGDFITETKRQGEEAGFWTTDSSGYRVYNYYSDNSNKGRPGQYSNSSYTAYSYGSSTPDNQGRSPYSQNTSYSDNNSGSGLGSGWATPSSDSSRRDSSGNKSKYKAPDVPVSKVRSDSSPRRSTEKSYSDNVNLTADKAKTDAEYKSKLDKLAALMTDVSIDESDLADMRNKNDLNK